MSLYLYHARGGRSIPAQKKTGSGRGSFSTLKPGGEPGPGAVKKACGAAWEQGLMAVVWDQEPLMLVYISTNALARAVCEKIPAGAGISTGGSRVVRRYVTVSSGARGASVRPGQSGFPDWYSPACAGRFTGAAWICAAMCQFPRLRGRFPQGQQQKKKAR